MLQKKMSKKIKTKKDFKNAEVLVMNYANWNQRYKKIAKNKLSY
jgi:hypothetical protein